jgi:RNA polymerase sigma-70 factor (ECF subfamily)
MAWFVSRLIDGQEQFKLIESTETGRYVQLLTDVQSRLYAFIYSLCGDHELARDVLQETNAVLWAKAAEYDAGRSFTAWALGIARIQVMAALQT